MTAYPAAWQRDVDRALARRRAGRSPEPGPDSLLRFLERADMGSRLEERHLEHDEALRLAGSR